MNSTGTPADPLRPEDRAKLDRLHAIARDVCQEYERKHGVKVLFRTRSTREEREAWIAESIVRQTAENNEKSRKAKLHRQQHIRAEATADRNYVYPDWAERRYQGD